MVREIYHQPLDQGHLTKEKAEMMATEVDEVAIEENQWLKKNLTDVITKKNKT